MKFKELRKNKGATQEEVAKMLNVVKSTYNGYENGNSEPTIATLCKLADYYGVSLDYLCDHKSLALELPPLDENQKQLIKVITQLNRDNLGLAYGFVMGHYQKQLQA